MRMNSTNRILASCAILAALFQGGAALIYYGALTEQVKIANTRIQKVEDKQEEQAQTLTKHETILQQQGLTQPHLFGKGATAK